MIACSIRFEIMSAAPCFAAHLVLRTTQLFDSGELRKQQSPSCYTLVPHPVAQKNRSCNCQAFFKAKFSRCRIQLKHKDSILCRGLNIAFILTESFTRPEEEGRSIHETFPDLNTGGSYGYHSESCKSVIDGTALYRRMGSEQPCPGRR